MAASVPFADLQRLFHIAQMQKSRLIALAAIVAIVVGIIAWDANWAGREANAAFEARLHATPKLVIDQQYDRGVICGSYQFGSQAPGRFIFVSYYSSGVSPEGLLISSDPTYRPTANKWCRKQ